MGRGWHYAKLSLSSALRLSVSGMCILLFLFFSLCRFCLFVFFLLLSLELGRCFSVFFCPADHVPDYWQPRVLLGMVEARSVNVVVVFFTLTDRASTIPSNILRGCQSGTWSAGQKKIRGTSTKLR